MGGRRLTVMLPALWRRGDSEEFHAVTIDLSDQGLRLRSATMPWNDEALTCLIRGIAPFQARVVGIGTCDFMVRVIGRDPSPGEVARRLVDLARQRAEPPEEVRVDRRVVPRRSAVQVTLADGASVPATILNVSVSGAALRLDGPPAVGAAITVGRRLATVARSGADGIGVMFVEPLREEAVGENIVL